MSAPDFASFRSRFAHLGSAWRENLVLFESVTSTNEVAREILGGLPSDAYPPAPTWIVAYEQTRGRGRLDRGWHSPPGGGLYCTLLWPLDGRQAPPLLPIAVAVALCDGVEPTGAEVRLKWPNDLLLDGRKLGGILIEVTAPAARAAATAIIGIGVNLSDAHGETVSLGGAVIGRRGGRDVAAAELLALLAPGLRQLERRLASPAELVASYRRRIAHRAGDRLTWRQGGETVAGAYVAIDDDGRLVLETPRGRRALAVGDIIQP